MPKTTFKQKVALLGAGALVLANGAFAETTVLGQAISIDTTDVKNMAAIIVAALATIWAFRKAIAFANKG